MSAEQSKVEHVLTAVMPIADGFDSVNGGRSDRCWPFRSEAFPPEKILPATMFVFTPGPSVRGGEAPPVSVVDRPPRTSTST